MLSLDEYGGLKSSLKVLNLKYVNVTRELIEELLCECVALEGLMVHGSYKLVNLRVVSGHPSLALKHLELHHCVHVKRLRSVMPRTLFRFVVAVKNLNHP